MSQSYRVEGMTCDGCAASITRAILGKNAAAKVDVELDASKVTVAGIDDDAVIEDAVEGAGFTFRGRY